MGPNEFNTLALFRTDLAGTENASETMLRSRAGKDDPPVAYAHQLTSGQ